MFLKRLAKLRKEIDSLKLEAEAIEPEAIFEALKFLESEQAINGKNLVFSDENAKIILVQRTRFDDKITRIVKLDEDINREYKKLCDLNSSELESNELYIKKLQEIIAQFQEKQKILLTSSHLESLKRQRAIALKETEHKIAGLSVYVK